MTTGKSIVIAGASSGIGAALARALAADGHRLYLCSRGTEELARTWAGSSSTFYASCDVGREPEVRAFFEQVSTRADSIDALIYCVGVMGPVGLFHEADSTDWFETLKTNLFGAFLMAKYAVPFMKAERRPRIIMLSGGGAFNPLPRASAYGVSKAATIRLVETLAVELAPRNIAVNAVAPGFVATEIHQATLDAGPERGGEHYEQTVRLLSEGSSDIETPIDCVRYMISDSSAKLTGKTISARFDAWGNRAFDKCIDQIVSSPLYSMQRINLVHLGDSALANRLALAVEGKHGRRETKPRMSIPSARTELHETEKVDADTCLTLYRMSRLIRRTEEVLMEEYASKQEMRCPMHFCVGQEAGPAALSMLLRPEDYLVSHYRSHGYYLAKAAPLASMIAEFYGKASGSNGGLGGSMELAHHDLHFYSGAIVGGPLGIAMGIAFALRYRSANAMAFAVFGDGALDEGVSYEALNLAALHGVPLLAICENNLYAAHTSIAKRTLSRSITERVRPFGVRTVTLDGTDVVRLHSELAPIVREVRAGTGGPTFVEISTYRYCGHVGPESDDWLGYRSTEEISEWKKRDPVALARVHALQLGVSEEALLGVENSVETEILAALDAAKKASFPSAEWSLAQVWSASYAPTVTEFTNSGVADFDSRQVEARLNPF